MQLTIKVLDANGEVRGQRIGEEAVCMLFEPEYQQGDSLLIESDVPGSHLLLQLEDTIPPALVYLKGMSYRFSIPFDEKRAVYSTRAFVGKQHLLTVRQAYAEEVEARRNLAYNPMDCHTNNSLFPHAYANVETRGEMTFAARNAIDGIIANIGHGHWPYSSWGINRDPEAWLKVDFGRMVRVDQAILYFRADFPHDAWWERVTLRFSDESAVTANTEKTALGQRIKFSEKVTEWVMLTDLIKADDPSPFPALRQIEIYGTEA